MDNPFKNKWYVMTAVAMGVFLATIDSSIVNIALPTLVSELKTTITIVEWVVLAYLLTLSVLMLSVGRLADIVGKKPLYVMGFIVFTIGSLLCGLSQNVYGLIGFRVLQAIGAAFIMVLGTAIITEAFPSNERGMAMGVIGTIVSIGVIAGPTIGGLILHTLKWNWIFFVNIPLGFIGVFLVQKFVPNVRPHIEQHFDILGAVAMFLALGSLLISLSLGQIQGFNNPLVLGLLGGFFIFITLFLIIEKRNIQPMLDLSLFKNSDFSINILTGFLSFVSMSGTIILLPFFLTNVLLFLPSKIGLLMGVVPLVIAFTSPISGKLSDRLGTRLIAILGLISLFLGILALSTIDVYTTALGYILRTIPIGLGMGLFQSPNNSAIMGSVPKNRLGIAAGMLSITRTLGQTTGIAIFGAVWASRVAAYLGKMPVGGASTAPAAIQATSMQDVLHFSSIVVFVAILLAIWAYVKERKLSLAQATDAVNS